MSWTHICFPIVFWSLACNPAMGVEETSANPADGLVVANQAGQILVQIDAAGNRTDCLAPASARLPVPPAPMTNPPRTVPYVSGSSGAGPGTLSGNWPTYGNGPSHSGYFPGYLSANIFSQKWVKTVTGTLNQVAVGGGKIFITPYQYFGTAFLTALDEETGDLCWRYDFASCYSINPPTYDGGRVYVQRGNHGTDTHLWCFDANTGSNAWRTAHAAQWERYMAPTIASGKIWIDGGYYGGMYGINQTTGTALFFLSSLEQYDGWTPMYCNGALYSWVAGHFRQHNPTNGAVLWDLNLGWSWKGWSMGRTIAAAGQFAACIGNSSEIYGIDLGNKQLAWRTSGAYSGTPAVANGVVYAFRGTAVAALSAASGALLGTFEANTSLSGALIVTDDVLITGSGSQTFVFDLQTFALRQTIPHGGWLSLANDVLYIAQSNGDLYAYKTVSQTTQLTVGSNAGLHGSPEPFPYGRHDVQIGSNFVEQVLSPDYSNQTCRYVCTGWTGTGDVLASGTNTMMVLALTNNSSLTWQWRTEHDVRLLATNGTVLGVSEGWIPEGFIYSAVPSNDFGYVFDHWRINGQDAGSDDPLSVTVREALVIEAVFTPAFVDVTTNVATSMGSWIFNPQTGTLFGTLILSNSASSLKSLVEPFWYLVESNQQQRLMHPDGIESTTGYPYLDITASVTSQMPQIGNGDFRLDPGESVQVSGIEFYNRYRAMPTGIVWAMWADPPSAAWASPAPDDTDRDGIPDAWEDGCPLLDKNNPFDAALDPDGDGFSNREEYEADTNPQDPASRLRLLNIPSAEETVTLMWQGGVLSTQQVESSDNLSTWTPIGTFPPPCLRTNCLILPAGPESLFLRVRVVGRMSP